jgi:integrase
MGALQPRSPRFFMSLSHRRSEQDEAAFLDALATHFIADPTVAELWRWWVTTPAALRIALDSIKSRARRWILPAVGELRARELTAEHVDQVLAGVLRAGRSAQTANHVLHDLRRLIHAAQGARRIPADYDCTAHTQPLQVPFRRRVTLELDEARELLDITDGRLRVLYALALFLGLRKGECLALERADVDLVHGELHVTKSHGRQRTKGLRGGRVLPICSGLAPILRAWLELGAGPVLLFPGNSASGRMGSDAALTKRLRAVLTAGAVCPLERSGKIRFHDLRHTFSTLADEAGIREEIIAAVMGHSPGITARYTHRKVARLRQELEQLKLT